MLFLLLLKNVLIVENKIFDIILSLHREIVQLLLLEIQKHEATEIAWR